MTPFEDKGKLKGMTSVVINITLGHDLKLIAVSTLCVD